MNRRPFRIIRSHHNRDQNENEQHDWHVKEEAQKANRLDEDGFGSRGEEWETHGEQETVAAAASSDVGRNRFRSAAFTGCRKRSDGRNAIRIPGHDRKKPHSSFHRFEKVCVALQDYRPVDHGGVTPRSKLDAAPAWLMYRLLPGMSQWREIYLRASVTCRRCAETNVHAVHVECL